MSEGDTWRFYYLFTEDANAAALTFIDDAGELVTVAKRVADLSAVSKFKTIDNYLHNVTGSLNESPDLEVSIQKKLKIFSKQHARAIGEGSADPAQKYKIIVV